MLLYRPFYIVSMTVMLLTKTAVVVYMASEGEYGFLSWRNSQELIQIHRNRVFRQLTLAIITFRIGRHMLKRSVVSFIIFSIVVIKLLTIQIKLVKLARTLKPFHGPIRLTACLALSAAFFYFKLMVEISWAAYYLVMLCKNPSIKDTFLLLLGLIRLLDWK
ncbi:hypothetical protein HYDPIDRAFT_25682 [Hydnomerulius pinastri MD-312]|nr:hypothetical protein HYDPIDRAFT_25682 [Hydnomerulius pinastri MD-312]